MVNINANAQQTAEEAAAAAAAAEQAAAAEEAAAAAAQQAAEEAERLIAQENPAFDHGKLSLRGKLTYNFAVHNKNAEKEAKAIRRVLKAPQPGDSPPSSPPGGMYSHVC